MLIASFPAGPFQTNCYVVATGPDADCVIIDPGVGATASVIEIVDAQRLKPQAVLCTHGHFDHVASVHDLTEEYGVPAYIHDADAEMLSLSFDRIGIPGVDDMMRQLTGADSLTAPAEVRGYPADGTLELAGLSFTTEHAPGHTPGCTLLKLPYAEDPTGSIDTVVFSGDVLFAGSIGRTDFPMSDHAAMQRTLREVVLALPDSAAVLSGHGGQTTIGRERVTNPYLQEDML